MDQIPKTPAQPEIKQPVPASAATNKSQPKAKSNQPHFLVYLALFIVGVVGGVLLYATLPKFMIPKTEAPKTMTQKPEEITVPKDAVSVNECVDRKGQVLSFKDNSQGPFYLVYKNKVIGLEYYISQDASGGAMLVNVKELKSPVNHIVMGQLEEPVVEPGQPNRYVDFYFVDASTEQAIKCKTAIEPTAVPSPSETVNEEAAPASSQPAEPVSNETDSSGTVDGVPPVPN